MLNNCLENFPCFTIFLKTLEDPEKVIVFVHIHSDITISEINMKLDI